jgi:hypothetical protein
MCTDEITETISIALINVELSISCFSFGLNVYAALARTLTMAIATLEKDTT